MELFYHLRDIVSVLKRFLLLKEKSEKQRAKSEKESNVVILYYYMETIDSLISLIPLIPDYIGLYAHRILGIMSLFLLRNKFNYLTIYIAGYCFNFILNVLLKLLLKEPRPKKTKRVLEIAIANDYGIDYEYEYEKFGMPSGHAQTCAYSLAFITLVFNDPLISSIYLFITCLTFLQRYKYLDHSILQLVVGFCVGISIGYMFYFIGNRFIKGNIKMRVDDYAPK